MGEVFLLALVSAVNPTLLAAVTVMLVLPNPRRLLLGYLLGAYVMSITAGLVIVFALEGTATESTARRTASPLEDIAFGAIFLLLAYVLGSRRGQRAGERRRARREAKRAGKEERDPFAQRMLGRGSARIAFVVGAALNLPGVSYLVALRHLDRIGPGAAATVGAIVVFNLIMLVLIEVPLIGYAFAPERTQAAVDGFKDWLSRRGRTVAARAMAIIGALLILRGLIELLT